MAHLALDRALPASWVDKAFQAHRSRQYPRELPFSSVVELMLLVTLRLRPSLHAAAREQAIELAGPHEGPPQCWRRLQAALHTPTDAGGQTIVPWSNLPPEIDAAGHAGRFGGRCTVTQALPLPLGPVLDLARGV